MCNSKHEWMVILPDKPNAIEKRVQVRPEHLSAIQPKVDSGLVLMGGKIAGAYLDKPRVPGETPTYKGSVILAEASSKEEVLQLLKEDIYSRSGVWDVEKAQIFPFISAVRKPLQ